MRKVSAVFVAILFMLALSAVSFAAAGASATVNGWVTDQQCAAKGANASAEACTKKCLAKGSKMVVVTDDDQKVLLVDNPDALMEHAGHHVAVTGTVNGDTIHVDSVKML
jgi:type 1 fimbria pilin